MNGYTVLMQETMVPHRYSKIAPAAAPVAGALHGASSQMGNVLEKVLIAELLASDVAKIWKHPSLDFQDPSLHRVAQGDVLTSALSHIGVAPLPGYPSADLWFMSNSLKFGPSCLVQVKSGSQLGKAQRAGEASGLAWLSSQLNATGQCVLPVLCAFDATTDRAAEKALGKFQGINTWCGPTLCLTLGIDYDRVFDRWMAAVGDPGDNDAKLAKGFYDSLVSIYGQTVADQVWSLAADLPRNNQD